MTIASRARRAGNRIMLCILLGTVFALGASSPLALADEVEYGGDEVVITVVITEFDPCSVGAAGCDGGGGALASTGATVGAALTATVLLTAVGVATVAATRRRAGALSRSAN